MGKMLIRFDWAIKELLHRESNYVILEGFLSELLFDKIKINQILEYETKENDCFNKLTILAQNSNNELICIEIQSALQIDYIQEKESEGINSTSENLNQQYSDITKLVVINIVYYGIYDENGGDYIYRNKGFNTESRNDYLTLSTTEQQLTENTLYWLKVYQFNDIVKNTLDEWIYFLKKCEVRNEFNAQGLKEARDKLEITKLSENERDIYFQYVGLTMAEEYSLYKNSGNGNGVLSLKNLNELIPVQVKKQELHSSLKQEACFLNQTRLQELVDVVNEILIEYKCPTINTQQIQFCPQFITNDNSRNNGLVKIIYDHYYPPASNGEYAHFTSLTIFESIITTQKIRLTSPIKRMQDGEYSLFYIHTGHFKCKEDYAFPFQSHTSDSEMETHHKNLMKRLFYISLTRNEELPLDNERVMWNEFGDKERGVRMVFDINTKHPDFRKVYYAHSCGDTLIARLDKKLREVFGKRFFFNSFSKFGAFFIEPSFSHELETRYLIKQGSDDYQFPYDVCVENEVPYIEIDLLHSQEFTLKSVQPGKYCDKKELDRIFKQLGPLKIDIVPPNIA